jgi:hypothetical protein
MAIDDLPRKRREKRHGDTAIPAQGAVLCQVSVDTEVHFERAGIES